MTSRDMTVKHLKTRIFLRFCTPSFLVFITIAAGCSTTRHPFDPWGYKNRSSSSVSGDVTVTVAVPTTTEAEAIYGVQLSSKFIQPVWVAVQNHSSKIYWFLPSGMDPNYFSPSEAGFAFHTGSKEADQQRNEKFRKLQFYNPVRPGSTEAGFVLTNLDEGFKALDIDILSNQDAKSFSFIVADPDFKADYKMVDFDALYAADEIIDIEDSDKLRQVLEKVPVYTTNAKGDEKGDPLNLVLIGDPNDIVPALVRRGWHATEVIWAKAILRTIKSFLIGERYRYSPISPLYVYSRKQDIGWQKARGTINKRNHMRFWLSPIRFRGQKVFIGQISRDIGVKFTLKSPTISTHVIDPDIDEARRYFAEDMAYSQALVSHGYVNGTGVVTRNEPRSNLVGDPFFTDGMRLVLFFGHRPSTLAEIKFLNWEHPSGFLKKK